MYLNILFHRLESASPEIKYFLIVYLKTYGFQPRVSKTVRDFVKDLGMNDRTIRKSIDYLADKTLLHKEAATGETAGRGRRRSRFSCGAALLKLQDGWKNKEQSFPNQMAIEAILFETDRKVRSFGRGEPRAENNDMLTLGQKLLLCALLAYSDNKGVVNNLSLGQLSSMIGLSKDQARDGVKKLKQDKYLLQYLPGYSGPAFGQIKSVFVLSLEKCNLPRTGRASYEITLEAMYVLRQSVKLARAIYALKEADTQQAKMYGKAQRPILKDIYGLHDDEYDEVIAHVDIYAKLGDVSGTKFERFRAFIMAHVAALIDQNGWKGMTNADQKVQQSIETMNQLSPNWEVTTPRELIWVSKIIYGLYQEICRAGLPQGLQLRKSGTHVRSYPSDSVSITYTLNQNGPAETVMV